MTQTTYTFSIGDRVLATGKIDGNELTGKYGTVIITGEHIGVQFDECIIGGHDCHGNGRHGYCWFCLPRYLQLVDEKDFEESKELLDFIQSFKCV